MWRDLFELNIALREASRVYTDPAIFSAIEKIEAAVAQFVQVEIGRPTSRCSPRSARRSTHREQIKIQYTSGLDGEAHERCIEPREIKVLNGHALRARLLHDAQGLAHVPRRPHQRASWRSPRSPRRRPPDPVANWLTQVGEEGDEVVVVVEPYVAGSSSPCPARSGWRWTTVATPCGSACPTTRFLDHLMLRAGAGCGRGDAGVSPAPGTNWPSGSPPGSRATVGSPKGVRVLRVFVRRSSDVTLLHGRPRPRARRRARR